MRFYTQQHRYYGGIDLHARSLFVCILDPAGQILVHRNLNADPDSFLKVIAPDRKDRVVAVECLFTGYWRADRCAREGIAFVLGHALYRKAIHGGKAKNDKIDAHKIGGLLRGGMLPPAYVYPPEMRATRDLLRRRTYLMRKRAQRLTPIQNTNAQYNLPERGKKIAYKTNREGIAERFPDPNVRKSIEIDLAPIEYYDQRLNDRELALVRRAKQHHVNTFYRLRSLPGVGKILALTLLYEIQSSDRFPRGQDFAS